MLMMVACTVKIVVSDLQELSVKRYNDEGVPSVIIMTGKKKIKLGKQMMIGKQQDRILRWWLY